MTETDSPAMLFPIEREAPLDPPAIYAELRGRCPIAPVQLDNGTPAWLVTRYKDVRAVLSDDRFGSGEAWRFQPSESRRAAEKDETSFTMMDPPQHTYYRKLLAKYFTTRRIQELAPAIQQIVDDAIDNVLSQPQPVDLVAQLALPIASQTMCHLIGVPYSDHAWFEERSNIRSEMEADPEEVSRATQDLLDFVDRLITSKIEKPADDLLTRFVEDLLVPGMVTRTELIAIVRLLLTAGHETTATMIATGIFVLLEHPDQLAALTDDAALVDPTVEELLRYISILHISLVRVAKQDLEFEGQQISVGDGLIVTPAAANKDKAVFPNPDEFDIHRSFQRHIAFGHGVHQCIGQAVARLELRTVFGRLFERVPDLQLAVPAADIDFINSNLVGVKALPVRW